MLQTFTEIKPISFLAIEFQIRQWLNDCDMLNLAKITIIHKMEINTIALLRQIKQTLVNTEMNQIETILF